MKKVKFTVFVWEESLLKDNYLSSRDVEGELIPDIKGFEGYQFVVYKDLKRTWLFNVAEKETGAIATKFNPCKSKQRAINGCIKSIKKVGVIKLEEMISYQREIILKHKK